jgi:hypothetical protein
MCNVCAPGIFLASVWWGLESYTNAKMMVLCLVCIFSVFAARGSVYFDGVGLLAAFFDSGIRSRI